MTTIRDLLNDLVLDVEERMQTFIEKNLDPKLTDEEKEIIVDEYVNTITERIVG